MKILMTIPTGRIGRRILPELLAPEFSVRVMARDPARLPADIRQQVEVVRGSTDDAATLCRALDGVDAMFWCVPSESCEEANVELYYERFATAAWQAIRKASTPRVVTISAGGKRLAREAGPLSALHAMEEILEESGAAIRHLRCGFFMENFLSQARSISERGFIGYPMPGAVALPMAAVADIADVALRWLVRRDWQGIEAVAVHGAESLSFIQAAAVMEQTLERPVQYREVSAKHYIGTLVENGASAGYARNQAEMFSELGLGILSAEPRTAESTTPTTLAAWTEAELLPAVELFQAQGNVTGPALNLNPAIHQHQDCKNGRNNCEYETQRIP